MHADIHLQLHHLQAAELHRAAAGALPHTSSVRAAVRAQVGWTLVALGLRLAVPANARPRPLAA